MSGTFLLTVEFPLNVFKWKDNGVICLVLDKVVLRGGRLVTETPSTSSSIHGARHCSSLVPKDLLLALFLAHMRRACVRNLCRRLFHPLFGIREKLCIQNRALTR